MAQYNISEIVTSVRKHIDEVGLNESNLVGGSDGEDMDAIITSKVTQAIDFVRSVAPFGCMADDVVVDNEVISGGGNAVFFEPQGNFMRFVKAECSAWQAPVRLCHNEADEEIIMAKDSYVGSTVNHPTVYEAISTNGDRQIWLLGIPKIGGNYALFYIPKARVTNNNVTFSERLYDAITLYMASLTLITFSETQKAAAIQEQVKSILESL